MSVPRKSHLDAFKLVLDLQKQRETLQLRFDRGLTLVEFSREQSIPVTLGASVLKALHITYTNRKAKKEDIANGLAVRLTNLEANVQFIAKELSLQLPVL